jgi:hypothetical protein
MTRAQRYACLLLVAFGCARMGPPPGAPPDHSPPILIGTIPESLAVLPGFDSWVEFRFDEVVSEGGQPNFGFGTGELERLITISPDSGVPRVRWRRDRIQVQPRRGWLPDRVYRVELAPGLRDLAERPNIRDSAAVVTFTTGAPLPTRWLEGRTVDWVQKRFAPATRIEALLLPDSLAYRTVTDSSGRFRFGPLPEGEYLVTAHIDVNSNRRRDAREAWDSVRVTAGQTEVGEIWTFPRDTMPPRIDQNGVTRADSFGITIALNLPVDPALRLESDAISILTLPDSTPMPAMTALPIAVHDSIYAPIDSARRSITEQLRANARRDSLIAVRADSLGISIDSARVLDSVAVAQAPQRPAAPTPAPPRRPGAPADSGDVPTQGRPAISNRLVIRLAAPLEPGKRYSVEVRGVRALRGAVADTLRGVLVMPDPPKPAADTAQADTTATQPADPPPSDSLPPRDSIPAGPSAAIRRP